MHLVHILKVERYRDDKHGPNASMILTLKRFISFISFFGGSHGVTIIAVESELGDLSSILE